MASSYPGGLDSFATNRTDATVSSTTHPADHNDANDAINKIEAELGTNPSDSFATVQARLAALKAEVDANTAGVSGMNAHAARHYSGGADPLTGTLNATARVGVRVNGVLYTRREIELIAGTGMALGGVDDATTEKATVTVTSLGGTGVGGTSLLRIVGPLSANYLALDEDHSSMIHFDTTAAGRTVTLPSAVGRNGVMFSTKRVAGANSLTVAPAVGGGTAYEAAVEGLSGLARYWRFGETSGTAAAEETGVAGTSTHSAGVTVNTTSLLTGDTNKCADYNGTTGYTANAGGRAIDLSSGDWTMLVWINADSFTSNPFIFGMASGMIAFGMRIDSAGLLKLWLGGVGGATNSSTTLSIATTYMLAMTWEASADRVRYYVNGAAAGDTAYTSNPTAGHLSATTIGAFDGGASNWFDGRIDEPAMFTRRLTDSEITNLYTAGTAGGAGQTVAGGATKVISDDGARTFYSNGANWLMYEAT